MDAATSRRLAFGRAVEMAIQAEAYQRRLRYLRGWNWVTVVLPAVLSAIAGATILAKIALPYWAVASGLLALLGSILSLIHKLQNCDEAQAEMALMRRDYGRLTMAFRSLADTVPDDIAERIRKLDGEIAELRSKADYTLPDRAVTAAARAVHRRTWVQQTSEPATRNGRDRSPPAGRQPPAEPPPGSLPNAGT